MRHLLIFILSVIFISSCKETEKHPREILILQSAAKDQLELTTSLYRKLEASVEDQGRREADLKVLEEGKKVLVQRPNIFDTDALLHWQESLSKIVQKDITIYQPNEVLDLFIPKDSLQYLDTNITFLQLAKIENEIINRLVQKVGYIQTNAFELRVECEKDTVALGKTIQLIVYPVLVRDLNSNWSTNISINTKGVISKKIGNAYLLILKPKEIGELVLKGEYIVENKELDFEVKRSFSQKLYIK